MGVSTLSLTAALSVFGTAAYAQAADAAAAPAGAGEAVEEVVVTGSRIVAAGFQAPTPVTVMSTEQLQRTAPGAIPEGLNQLPQFAGSRSNTTPGGLGNTPSTGNYLNLRNLGTLRNLVLLDGQRLPPTSYEGITDANIIPQALVQRVEVVTGGASAAYGSDAVSGVINFILDTRFNGVKGQLQFGKTEIGDSPSIKGNIAFGGDVLNGRVHVLASYDHYEIKGLTGNESRDLGRYSWMRTGAGTAANPYEEHQNVRFSNAAYGTQISTANPASNPLRGYQFIPGGLAVPMNLGTPTGSAGSSIGGDGPIVLGRSLTGTQDTDQFFGRVDFEVVPGVEAFAQMSYSDSFASSISVGSGTQVGDFRIFTDNAFLADSTRNILRAAGVDSFIGSRIQADQPPKLQESFQKAAIFVSGLKGRLGDTYDWNLGYSHGDTKLKSSHYGNFNNQRYYAGLDAVRDASGRIVCRITITNPGLLDDCIPFNIFGNGSPSKAAYDYISQSADWAVHQKMDIFNANISGEVFTLPAGPVAVAVGGEYRRQTMVQTSNADPSRSIDLTGLRTNTVPFLLKFNSTNVGETTADQNVKEGYAEVAIPILKDMPFAQDLSINAAGRYTDYSTSGGVKTWKVGASYTPVESIRLRLTRSRDIRAPTLNELFAATNSGQVAFLDVHTNTSARLTTTSTGNPNLTPELGDTFTIGAVFQPTFVPRLQMSVDYYKIRIKDAIGTPNAQTLYDECEQSNGTAAVCSTIIRPFPFSNRTPANFPTLRTSFPINQAKVEIEGIDFEISYRAMFDWGLLTDSSTLDMRLVGGHLMHYLSQNDAASRVLETNNSGNNSANRVNVSFNWRNGPLTVSTQTRFIGKRKKDQDPQIFFAAGYTKDIPAVSYTDATVNYRFEALGGDLDAYLTITNLFDKQPPLIPGGGQPGQPFPTNTQLYDIFGRTYTVGLRASF
jgi:outer membrane receptor protein involved in Fe transport